MSNFKVNLSTPKSTSIGGKIFGTLFLALFLCFGLAFVGFLTKEIWAVLQSYSWPQQPCVITQSSVLNDPKNKGDDPYVLQIEYRYEVAGQTFASTRFSGKRERSSDWNKINDLALRYPPGAQTVCYVNPTNPAEALLQHQQLWFAFALLIPLVFVLVGGGGIYVLWMAEKPSVQPGPLSASAKKRGGTWFLVFFFGVFALVGIGGTAALAKDLAEAASSEAWTETPCTVESSRVLSHKGKDSTTYSVDILYRYSVGGRDFKSNRYSFMGGSSSGYQAKRNIVAQYPPGTRSVCYVDPGNPAKAVLFRGFSWSMLIILVPFLFALVGIGGILFALRSKSDPVRPSSWASSPPSPSTAPAPSPIGTSPAVLKPKVSAFAKMCGAIVVSLFWNGIVSVFLYEIVSSFQQGRPDWFLTLFMTPFVVIGLGMIGSIFYFALSMANPVAKIALQPAAVPLGGTLRLGWGFEGKTERIHQLSIHIEAREEATYRRGTSTCTDRHVFFHSTVVELSDRRQIPQGMAEIEIPAGLMPSFASANNKIVWTLTLHGQIHRWPDVKEEFDLHVLPPETRP